MAERPAPSCEWCRSAPHTKEVEIEKERKGKNFKQAKKLKVCGGCEKTVIRLMGVGKPPEKFTIR